MKIGDRVAYNEENVALDDIHGTVAEPTEQERIDGMAVGDVLVDWDDGERFWEDPESLVVIEEADA
jgi:hypothetical protein